MNSDFEGRDYFLLCGWCVNAAVALTLPSEGLPLLVLRALGGLSVAMAIFKIIKITK